MATPEPIYHSRIIEVPQAFAPVFSHFYQAQNRSSEPVHKTLLPHFQTILAFSFGPEVLLHGQNGVSLPVSQCMVLGPIKRALSYTLPPGAEILVANFKDDAFYRFFGPAMLQEPLHPDALLEENCFTHLWHTLQPMETDQRVAHILQFCRPYLGGQHAALQQMVQATGAATPLNPVKAVAQETGRSERWVQLQLKKQLGYSAKEVSRYQRFMKAVQLVQGYAEQEQRADWFEILEQCGYYDQSQLAHDFNFYLRTTPSQFYRFQQSVCVPGRD